MSRLLHWGLLGGCALLVALFSPLAWQSVLACEFPADCRGERASSELALHAQPAAPSVSSVPSESVLEERLKSTPVEDRGNALIPMVGTLALGGDLLGGELGGNSGL